MARFRGVVGYGISEETAPGVWTLVIHKATYSGDLVRETSRANPSESFNGTISVGHSVSVVADKFAIENYQYIKYVEVAGVPWSVTSVQVMRPRLILSLGEVYNGPTS